MNKRTLKTLEYNKVLELLSEYAQSDAAKVRCSRLKVETELTRVQALQQETRDAYLRLERYGGVSFSGVHDLREIRRLLEVKSPLTAEELLTVAELLECSAEVKTYGVTSIPEGDTLSALFGELIPMSDISSEIRRCIITSEEIADDASPALRSIRRSITMANAELHSTLNKLIKSEGSRDKLMDSIITMRNGRYCIPVKVEYKNSFPGMVHDRSSTGATLFIEPMEAVALNNKLSELANEEKAEIEKILSDLSLMAGSALEDIVIDFETLVKLDVIFAKASFARATNSSEPVYSEDGIVELKAAIHPLLDRHTAVPVDIGIGKDYTLLIVTGPNTGGKTVSLKTLGLLSLMGQAGLHIPAMAGSRLSIFTDIFADIGDEQSIEQSLSTFSSHMSNISYIVKHADDRSLCLFDEPGGGTDPAEGAALAIAILEYLRQRGTRVMATTHYTELKTYAIGTDGVQNASCEFDEKTLSPTYRLIIGQPGASNAFAIAGRLGLPTEIIDSARTNMDESHLSMEQIINELDENRKALESEKLKAEELGEQAERTRQSLTDKEKSLDKRREEILEKAREEARDMIADAKQTADKAIRDYNKWLANPSKADAKRMEQERSSLREKASKYDSSGKSRKPDKKSSGHKASDFHIGDSVHIISLDTDGHILEKADNKGLLLVGMGLLSSRFSADDLVLTEDKDDVTEKYTSRKSHGDILSASRTYTFKPEINLLGKTVDEALAALDKFMDDALMAHCSEVRIVHGKGTGALRSAVTAYLKKAPYVESFRKGEFGEGDSGVTIVKL